MSAGDRYIGPTEQCAGRQSDQRDCYCIENPVSQAGVEDRRVFVLLGARFVGMKEAFCGVGDAHGNLPARTRRKGTLPRRYSRDWLMSRGSSWAGRFGAAGFGAARLAWGKSLFEGLQHPSGSALWIR